jgi:Domain of unknown function (DUF4956)
MSTEVEMADKHGEDAEHVPETLPRPRLGWLALFQIIIIALVILMARESRMIASPDMLEDQLGALADTPGNIAAGAWAGRGWLTAVVAMVGALLLMLPVAWAYVATRAHREYDRSVVTTIIVLPIAVAAILVIVQDSLAVAFSLAGIAGLVRFRNSLDDTRDAMYVIVAIAVGLGAGVGTLEASAALSGLFNLAIVALWKWNRSQPVIADIALGELTVPEGQTVLQAIMTTPEGERHPRPVAEWFKPGEAMPLAADGSSPRPAPSSGKREGMLRVHAADDLSIRRTIEEVLDTHTKRWLLETDDPGPDGLPTLTYCIKLKKRIPAEGLLEALRERLGPKLAEFTPNAPAGNGAESAP